MQITITAAPTISAFDIYSPLVRQGLPPEVARAFFSDMRAHFSEKDKHRRDRIAVNQLRTLQEFQGPLEKKLQPSDMRELFDREGPDLTAGVATIGFKTANRRGQELEVAHWTCPLKQVTRYNCGLLQWLYPQRHGHRIERYCRQHHS